MRRQHPVLQIVHRVLIVSRGIDSRRPGHNAQTRHVDRSLVESGAPGDAVEWFPLNGSAVNSEIRASGRRAHGTIDVSIGMESAAGRNTGLPCNGQHILQIGIANHEVGLERVIVLRLPPVQSDGR